MHRHNALVVMFGWSLLALATLGWAPAPGPPGPTVPAAAAPAPTPQTAPAPQDPFTRDLMARLNSTDAAQRAAAQKELAAIAGLWQQPEILQKMQEATPDPELKAFIQDRLNDLKARQAQLDISNLPPISLRVNNASIDELATALNETLHGPQAFLGSAGRGGFAALGGFTLEVRDKPFWEVFATLSQQEPLTISASVTGMRLLNSGTSIRRYALSGPAIAYVNTVNYQRSANLQNPAGDPSAQISLSAQVTLGVDPRVRVARITAPSVIRAVDDAGHNLASGSSGGALTSNGNNMLTVSVQLQAPETLGKSMTLTLEGRITAIASDTVAVLKDVESNVGASVTAGTRNFRVQSFTSNGTTLSFNVGLVGGQPADPTLRPTVILLDSAGKPLWSYSLMGGVGTSIPIGSSTGPYRLEFHVPDKTVDIPVHFELKDVPLP